MRSILLLAALALWAPAGVSAEGFSSAVLRGRVVDPAGVAVAGIEVTAESDVGVRSTKSGEDGSFVLADLIAGSYRLVLPGADHDGVEVRLGPEQTATVELVLRMEESQQITVVGTTEVVGADSAWRGSTLSSEMDSLAFGSRNYQSVIELFPTVVHDSASRFSADRSPAISGGQSWEIVSFVDGVDTSFPRSGGRTRVLLPATAIAQIDVQSTGFGAEYGRGVSGVIQAVVRSGGPKLHGTFLYTPQNQRWRSAYRELDIPREDRIEDAYEASLGGPLTSTVRFFASHSETSTNRADALADGSPVNVSFRTRPALLKLAWVPNAAHRVQLLGVDAPIANRFLRRGSADPFTVCECAFDEELLTASWSHTLSASTLLEAKVSTRQERTSRAAHRRRELDPSASTDDPLGNHFLYQDQRSGLRYNGLNTPTGAGFDDLPRDQANVSLTMLRGAHELSLGLDIQAVEFATRSDVGQLFLGNGYDPTRPGGFRMPRFKRVFEPSGVVGTQSDFVAFFVKDRIQRGRFIFDIGARFDSQELRNDIGEDAGDYAVVAPRFGVAFDASRNGRVVVRASAGRYYEMIAQELVTREYARRPNGTNVFEEFSWNPASRRYDRFSRRAMPALDTGVADLDPYYKDEVSLGVDLQIGSSWRLDTRWSLWEISDLYWSTDQFDRDGRVVRDVRNWADGFRENDGLVVRLRNDRSRDWLLSLSYAWGGGNGNMFSLDDDDLFEGLGGLERMSGVADATVVHRVGAGPFDRERNARLALSRGFRWGGHHLSVGGLASHSSGERWGRLRNVDVRHPTSGAVIRTTSYIEPRDAQQLSDTFTLNASVRWSFPLPGATSLGARGELGVEIANWTDEQEVIGINTFSGRPQPGIRGYQAPREVRFLAGVSF